jgi:uncharacterized membrane-anchored protein
MEIIFQPPEHLTGQSHVLARVADEYLGHHPSRASVNTTRLVDTEISDFSNRGFGHGSAQQGIGYA